jgi:predicted nuclease of predicted toxin-antitoxin system
VKILLDAGVPWRTRELLTRLGHDAVHANDVRIGADDAFLVDWAIKENRIIITLDADFHAILAERKAHTPSVVRLRIEILRHEEAALLIDRILDQFRAELETGVAISANRTKVRLHPLPLP